MFQICRDVEAVGFPVQKIYKMTYGYENATFEPLNPWTVTFSDRHKKMRTIPLNQHPVPNTKYHLNLAWLNWGNSLAFWK